MKTNKLDRWPLRMTNAFKKIEGLLLEQKFDEVDEIEMKLLKESKQILELIHKNNPQIDLEAASNVISLTLNFHREMTYSRAKATLDEQDK